MSPSPTTSARLLDPTAPATWPTAILEFLEKRFELFEDWSPTGCDARRFSASEYDTAVYALRDLLRDYCLIGWHCTRLTDPEIAAILAHGMQPPSRDILNLRIDTLVEAGHLSPGQASALIRAVWRYPDLRFLELTGCEEWDRPLGSGPR